MNSGRNIPLLVDHHSHFILYGLLEGCLDLAEVGDKEQAMNRLLLLPRDKISIVLGWNSSYYSFTEEDQHKLPPLLIYNLSLHSLCITAGAREQLRREHPEIVRNYTDSHWYEQNFFRMMRLISDVTEPSLEAFRRLYDGLKKQGIYHIQEMLLPSDGVFELLYNSDLADRLSFWADLNTFKSLQKSTRAALQGIKFFTDGAVGACTAAMRNPYKNGRKGALLFTDEELFYQLKEAGDLNRAISVHAIGDLAKAQAVRVIRELLAAGITFPHIRMEHCQFISLEDARTARDLGIILSMQPNFNADNYYYTDRLTEGQLAANNPFRMLIDRVGFTPGVDLIFGSDGMPHGAQAALSSSLFPRLPAQRLTLEEFVSGYCLKDTGRGRIKLNLSGKEVQVISVGHNTLDKTGGSRGEF
jgi:predicted amidohydrolase YtcJ